MHNLELTSKEIMISILHRWKIVLSIAVVTALAIAGVSYYTRSNKLEKLSVNYENEIYAFNENISAKQTSIAFLGEVQKAAGIYNERSLLMQVDPYNKQVAHLIFNVEVDPNTFFLDASDQRALGFIDLGATQVRGIVSRYNVLGNSAKLNELLKPVMKIDYDETYLREVVSIQPGEGIVTISVIGSDLLDAKLAVDAIYTYLEGKKPLVSSLVNEHNITIVDQGVNSFIDTQLADMQHKQRALASDTVGQIASLYKEIEELERNRPIAPTLWPHVLQNLVLGLILGLVLGLVLVVLMHLARMPVQFASQVQNQLGVRFLGGVKPNRKGLFVTRLKNRIAGEQLLADEPEGFRLAGANIAQLAGGHRRVLVTGTLPEQDIARAAQQLSLQLEGMDVTLVPSAGVTQSADAVNSLGQSDAVVFVERLQQSRLRDVLMEKERVELAGKPVLGYVLV